MPGAIPGARHRRTAYSSPACCSQVTHGDSRGSLRPLFVMCGCERACSWKTSALVHATNAVTCTVVFHLWESLGSQARGQASSGLSTGHGTSPSEAFSFQISSGVLLLSVLSSLALSWWCCHGRDAAGTHQRMGLCHFIGSPGAFQQVLNNTRCRRKGEALWDLTSGPWQMLQWFAAKADVYTSRRT